MSQQINLFNPILLKQKKHFSAVAMAQGLGLILLGSVAVTGYARWQLAALEANAVSTEKQLNAAKAQLAKITADYAPRKKSKALEDEILRMEAELKSRQLAFDLVQKGVVGNASGYAEYLRAFSRQVVGGLWLTGFTVEGSDIELRGRALQPEMVPAFINRLRQEPVMRGKSFAKLVMTTPEADPPASAAAEGVPSAPKRRVPAGYIEFVLRSTDLPPAQAGAVGAVNAVPGLTGSALK